MQQNRGTFVSDISGDTFSTSEKVLGGAVRQSLFSFIQNTHPDFATNSVLALTELNKFKEAYISDYMVREMGELSEMEKTVLSSMADQTTLSDKIEDEILPTTTGQRIADKVATFGGSWTFIIAFGTFIFLWISLNVVVYLNKGFDPYPFILLNLILSCIAAIQAPVIMMSQNRQEEKDRDRSKKDYMINLKSELEIRILHEKIDHLIIHQQQELLEIQQMQIEMMNDILKKIDTKH